MADRMCNYDWAISEFISAHVPVPEPTICHRRFDGGI
jgi:hypothetical protein